MRMRVCVRFYISVNSFGPLDMAINSFCFRLVRHFLFTLLRSLSVYTHLSMSTHHYTAHILYLRSIYYGQTHNSAIPFGSILTLSPAL